jgi:predicted MFS family arabinose efflux permease
VIAEAGRTSRLGLNDFAKHIRSGVAYCLSDKYVFRVLCLAVFLNLVIATREVVWFPTLKLELRLSESEIGTLSSAVAAVIGLASLFVTKAAGDPSRRPVLLLTGQAAVVAGGFCFVIPPSITTVALGSVLIGVGGLMHGIPSALVRKERVPSHLQGAALAVARIVSRLVVPVTMFLTTWLSKTFGVTSVVAFMTTVAALASLAICAKRPVRWRVSGEVHHQ